MGKEKDLAFLPHLLSLLQSFLFPLGLIGIIVTYVVGEKELKEQSKTALNWQLSLLIYSIVSAILMFILIGFLLLLILWILNIIFSILALIKSQEGEAWDYPLSIKFIK